MVNLVKIFFLLQSFLTHDKKSKSEFSFLLIDLTTFCHVEEFWSQNLAKNDNKKTDKKKTEFWFGLLVMSKKTPK